MKLFRLLLRHGGWTLLPALALSAAAGSALAALMRLIHRTLTAPPAAAAPAVLEFGVLLAVYFVGKVVAERTLADTAERLRHELRLALLEQVFAQPLRLLERIGFARLWEHLQGDVGRLAQFVGSLPASAVDLAVAAGCLAYMAMLSPPVMLFNVGFLAVAAACFFLPSRRARRFGHEAAAAAERESALLDYALRSTASLVQRDPRREDFMETHFRPASRRVWRLRSRSELLHIVVERFSEVLILLNVACLLFVLPRWVDLPVETATGVLLAAIFARQPLKDSLDIVPRILRARVALERMQESGLHPFADAAPRPPAASAGARPDFRTLRLDAVSFRYETDHGADGFGFGPVSLDVRAGEILFVVGGNGVGKTTLLKLLCGLYPPAQGRVVIDGFPVVDEAARARQRALFSVVHPGDPVFDHLLGTEPAAVETSARRRLRQLGRAGRVALDGAKLSTVDLSQGLRRRLLLMNALCEDTPVLLLDEWAADQDPEFRRYFYEELVPAFRREGRTLVLATHDDRYFHLADRVLKLESGRLVALDSAPSPARGPAAI